MAEDQVDVGVGQHLVGDDGAGVAGFPLHGRKRDDLDVRKRLHLLFEAFLDIERVGIAWIAEHLQHLALHRAVFGLQQFFGLVGGDMADFDRSGD